MHGPRRRLAQRGKRLQRPVGAYGFRIVWCRITCVLPAVPPRAPLAQNAPLLSSLGDSQGGSNAKNSLCCRTNPSSGPMALEKCQRCLDSAALEELAWCWFRIRQSGDVGGKRGGQRCHVRLRRIVLGARFRLTLDACVGARVVLRCSATNAALRDGLQHHRPQRHMASGNAWRSARHDNSADFDGYLPCGHGWQSCRHGHVRSKHG